MPPTGGRRDVGRQHGDQPAGQWRAACGFSGARAKFPDKVAYLQRVIAYQAATWPPTPAMEQEINRLQRWATTQARGVRKGPDEDVGVFLRRRARAAARIIAPERRWGRQSAVLARKTYDVMRDARAGKWPHELAMSQDAAWLRERRLAEGSTSSAAGRIGVRAAMGRVAPRLSEHAPQAPAQ